jgi:signal transduction protein with GAF and PtsI domain
MTIFVNVFRFKDLGRRILACLQEDSSHRELSPDSILIGEEISTALLNYLLIILLQL